MKNLLKKRITRCVILAATILSVCLYSCKKEKNEDDETKDHVYKSATAILQATYMDTLVSGTGTFTQTDHDAVTLRLDITVPSRANKSVAVHLHMMNDCGNNGNNAMGHWNPTNALHGKFGVGSYHLGDIGNISLDSKGHAIYEMTTDAWNINGNDTSRNVVGRSIIIHSGVDDYLSQPSGNSGNRIGCGGIQKN